MEATKPSPPRTVEVRRGDEAHCACQSEDRQADELRSPDAIGDIVGASEGAAPPSARLAELKRELRKMDLPRDGQEKDGTKYSEMTLGAVGGPSRADPEVSTDPVKEHRPDSRDHDEPQQQPAHHEFEGQREDEEADVLALDRIDGAEAPLIQPQQEGLPMASRHGAELVGDEQRNCDQGHAPKAAPGDRSSTTGDEQVRPHEQRREPCGEHVERASGRLDTVEDAALSNFVEPQGARQYSGGQVSQHERHPDDNNNDGCAATGTEDERPMR